ncbi:putative phylloplanin [Helianthus annuus]|nr:putative phylloplanin [Helianthus annuus]KAJ0769676.1 putative phylloplanin [Helianthus annuus]KAJ0775411.1 putative phylloplanin [Helianthus annuus]
MAMKFTILVSILVLVLIAAQADEAQGLGTITAAVNISGIVTCSVNGSANAPPFANALVELSCGGNVIASAVTNAQGVFNITVNPLRVTLTNLLSSCRIIVATPLSNCNATKDKVLRTNSSTNFLSELQVTTCKPCLLVHPRDKGQRRVRPPPPCPKRIV